MSDPEGNSVPPLRLGKHQDSRENKTNWFPEGSDIKCFVIFLDFHFNSNKRITGLQTKIVDSVLITTQI